VLSAQKPDDRGALDSSDERKNGDEAGEAPVDRRSLPGNQTMQLDALGDEIFEELDQQYAANQPAAAPPPLPPKKLWNARSIATLIGVIVGAAVLGVLASLFMFSDEEPAPAATVADGTTEPAAAEPSAGDAQEEGEPEVVPLQLDEVVIEAE
jgi:hypothetical protein